MAFLEVAVLPLRVVQALFTIIVLGLTAYIVDAYSTPWASWSPHSVNFMLFTSIWTILAVIYLVLTPSRFPRAAHKLAILGVEAVTMIFWFAAWVAVAALWGDWWKPARTGSVWGSGVAAIVFGAFIWLSFVATTVIAALHVRRTSSGNTAPPPEMQMQMQGV